MAANRSPVAWLLPREELVMAALPTDLRRISALIAGPGMGKSTLAKAWADRVDAGSYTLSSRDRDVVALARGIYVALTPFIPSLEAGTRLPTPRGSDDEVLADALASELCDAMSQLQTMCGLVLDDLDEIEGAAGSLRFIEILCRRLPEHMGVMLCSRTPLPFPTARMIAQGRIRTFDAHDLAFSPEETVEVMRGVAPEIDEGLARSVHRLTDGWPAGVRLAAEHLSTRTVDPDEALAQMRRPGSVLFNYLTEELFAREPPEQQALYIAASLFDTFDADLLEAVGVPRASAMLAEGSSRGLFIQAVPDRPGWYRMQDLMRRIALDFSTPETSAQIMDAGASRLIARHLFEDAARVLQRNQNIAVLGRMIADNYHELMRSLDSRWLREACEAIPASDRSAVVDVCLGRLLSEVDRAEAIALLSRARRSRDLDPWHVVRFLAEIYADQDQPEEILKLASEMPEPVPARRDACVFHAWCAIAHLNTGARVAARETADRALDLASEAQDDEALAAAHHALASVLRAFGEATLAIEHLHTAERFAEAAFDDVRLYRIEKTRSSILRQQTRNEEALRSAERALDLADRCGISAPGALAELGMILAVFDRLDEAIAVVERSYRLCQQLGISPLYAALRLGDLMTDRGNFAQAAARYEEALVLSRSSSSVMARSPVLARLARVIAHTDPDRAKALLEEALQGGEWPARAQVLHTYGWLLLKRGDAEGAEAAALEALHKAREMGGKPVIARSLEVLAMARIHRGGEGRAALEEALAIWKSLGGAAAIAACELALGRLDPSPAGARRRADAIAVLRSQDARWRSRPLGMLSFVAPDDDTIAVTTLGGFAVMRRGHQVDPTEWQSKKARDLLKILICRRGRPVPREMLIEMLWPDESPERVGNRMAVALTTLRSVLGRDEEAVIADKTSVSLNLDVVDVDVERFLKQARAGLDMSGASDSRALLRSAASIYAGDFLEEDPYSDWAVTLREEARAVYLTVARRLRDLAREDGDLDSATTYALRILERDPYDEEASLGLVADLAKAGRHGESRRAYRQYAQRAVELGLEPATFPA
jgi:ATP/maltotriose-dependent transcriptional regulator MalT/DNA-binding SARP family transcriptional activator